LKTMEYLPIFLRLQNAPCLVVGGGAVAARKVGLLLKAGARVTVVAPELHPQLAAWVDDSQIAHRKKAFEPTDLAQQQLAIAATDQAEINSLVSDSARRLGLPVNVVDQPALCSFIFPAVIDRSPIVAAVSSGGASPVLARLLRDRIEQSLPAAYGRLAELARRYRQPVKQALPDSLRRNRFWQTVLQGTVAERVLAGREQEAAEQLERMLRAAQPESAQGEVYLVGAGPGDPDLLTLRALRLMQQADSVVYDRLVSPAILERVRTDAEKIYAGKQRSDHALPQEQINELLVRLARQGKRVLRLKGGDPFIFGRGGEEIETLMEQGIPFQVVPGITAACGCAAYAGIPLTHRDYAQSCVFVTGHRQDGSITLDWPRLAAPHQTVVVYMGLLGLETICQQLIAHGCPADHPAALIEQGTTAQQRVIAGTLSSLPQQVAQAQVQAPTLAIIGEVVRLREKLDWFQQAEPS
jgi:uroporphyrin-III C-methyltransferase/precorrin-2 dehydrogenase/sirohydrochlorin ferrochelatase